MYDIILVFITRQYKGLKTDVPAEPPSHRPWTLQKMCF
jgi:hypothetical protein